MKSCKDIYQDAQSLIEAGRPQKAIKALEDLLNLDPDFAQAHFELGTLYWGQENKAKALEHYQASIDLEPGNIAYHKKLADLYYTQLDNVGEALKHYQTVVETCPDDTETLMILGNLNIVEKRFDGAADYYQKILDIEPWHYEASSMLERLKAREQGNHAGPTPEASYQKSQALFQAGNIAAAIETLENLIADHPEFALAHNDLGVLSYQCGLKDEAFAHYQEAVRLEPFNSVYQKNLADFYYVELGRTEDALEIYLRVLREEPTDIETLMAAGYISLNLNRLENASVFCNRVLEIEPWNADAIALQKKLSPTQNPNQGSLDRNV